MAALMGKRKQSGRSVTSTKVKVTSCYIFMGDAPFPKPVFLPIRNTSVGSDTEEFLFSENSQPRFG
jgi:hypothetical protein